MSGTKSGTGRAQGRMITMKQKLFIAAIVRGENIKDAARCAGIRSRSTCYRWLEWPHVIAAIEQHRADRADAASAIRALAKSEKVPPMVRYKAACTLAEMTSGAAKGRGGAEDKDATIASTILPSGT